MNELQGEPAQEGERRYLKNLNDITAFVAPYLEEMGVRLGTC